MRTFDDMLSRQLQDREFRKEYEAVRSEMEAIRAIVDTRTFMIPNAETIVALAEYDNMKKNSSGYKRYSSSNAMMDDILEDA